jgi:hypothetical protein
MFTAIALTLLAAAQAPRAPLRDAAPPRESGTAVVRGRVTDAETGAPLRRVTVSLSLLNTRDVRDTTSDANGAFRFTRLAAGEYTLTADPTRSLTTHRPGTYGGVPGKPLGRHSTIELEDGEIFDANIALPRSYVIAGRVVDDEGEPVADVRVDAESLEGSGNTRSRSTDDRGAFRLWGYSPGTYRVCANPVLGGPDHRAREGTIKTCYPASSESDAQPVVITNADPPEVEIRLRRSRLFTVSGIVIDATGAPAAEAHVSFVIPERFGGSSRGIQNAGGTFSIGGVAPGEYFIRAESANPYNSDVRNRQAGLARVHVDGANVENVVVAMERGGSVSGRIVFEGAVPADVRSLTVRAELHVDSPALQMRPPPPPARVKPDLSFAIDGLFGPHVLLVEGAPGWVIKSMRYRNEDRAHLPTEFKAGPDSTTEIVLTNRTARLAVRLIDERGQPTEDGRVVLFPADPRQWMTIREVRHGVMRDGVFQFQNLRAGDYLVASIAGGLSLRDRRSIEEAAKLAERVTLMENDQRTIDVANRREH